MPPAPDAPPDSSDAESRYRAVVEQSADAIVVVEGTICVYANDAYLRLVGVSDRADVIGRSGDAWLHPDDRILVNQRALARQRGERVPPRYEFRIRRATGEIRTVEVAATVITHNGRPATLAILRDVTEAKQHAEDLARLSTALRQAAEARDAALAEANAERARLATLVRALEESETRLRLALKAARMGIWDWDVGAGRLTWSEELERLHGMAPGSFDGTYETWLARIHPDDRERVTAAIQRALRDRAPYELTLRVVWDDGSVHLLAASGEPVFDETGSPIRMLGATHEVSSGQPAASAPARTS